MAESLENLLQYLNQSDEVISLLAAELINKIAKQNPSLAELIRAAAIPHRFDKDVLNTLQKNSEEKVEVEQGLKRMQKFSFVYEVSSGVFSYHEEVRNRFLRFWQSPEQRNEYIKYSKILRIFFSQKGNFNEMLYHWFVVEPKYSFSEFLKKVKILLRYYELIEAEVLIRLAQEQSWNLTPIQQIWIKFYEADINRFFSNWKEAKLGYEEVLAEKNNLTEEIQAMALHGLGNTLSHLGYELEGKNVLEQSIAISKKCGDSITLYDTLLSYGWCNFRLGNLSQAIKSFEQVLNWSQKAQDIHKQSWALTDLGHVYRSMESWDVSISYYQRSLELRKQIEKNDFLIGRSLRELAIPYIQKGDLKSALPLLEEALLIQSRIKDLFGLSHTFAGFGRYYKAKKSFDKAADFFKKSLDILDKFDAKREIIIVYKLLAEVYLEQNFQDKANFYYKRAAQMQEELNEKER